MTSYHLFVIAYVLYTIGVVVYLLQSTKKLNLPSKVIIAILVMGVTAHTFGLLYRWKEAGNAPFTNMYESLIFFSWVIVLGLILMELFRPLPGLGAIVLPVGWLIHGYAVNAIPVSTVFGFLNKITAGIGGPSGWFPPPSRDITMLPPALDSYWLEIHVITCFIAYGAFAIAFGTGVLYLWKVRKLAEPLKKSQPVIAGGSGTDSTEQLLFKLDENTYWLVAFGFILLGIGIITGAVWANETWGSYWSWDPKETWSLITWMVYAVFLHTRLVAKWRGPKTAWLAVIGFIAVLVCYYGVNVILPRFTDGGLHAYGSQ